MKTEVLLRSIGKINDELIADAESEANTKRKPGWAKLGIMAACLALVLCTGIATHAIRSNATACRPAFLPFSARSIGKCCFFMPCLLGTLSNQSANVPLFLTIMPPVLKIEFSGTTPRTQETG